MPARRFATLDVFTRTALAGNPLAVVLDADGLDAARMQAIAREFNLSETVFVLPPRAARHRARLRIFTPAVELPFAGHPIVGTAVLLALEDRAARNGADALAFGLEVEAGTLACLVETGDGEMGEGAGSARFRTPGLPAYRGQGLLPERLAPLIGLAAREIGFRRHAPSRHEASPAGPGFTFVPVASAAALDAARLDAAAFARARARGEVEALYLYAPDDAGDAAHEPGRGYLARMFAPHLGVPEDPATGSAAAAFAGVLMQFEPLGPGTHDIAIEQGRAMGRPSEIALQVSIEAGRLAAVEIGGAAVRVSEGRLRA